MTDYRAQAHKWAGPGNEKHVDTIAVSLHYNESIHMHDLAKKEIEHDACGYCWLRAGRAVYALIGAGVTLATPGDIVVKAANVTEVKA